MSPARKADVIVPVYRDTGMTLRCLESVLAHSGPVLRSLIVVDDCSPEPDMQDTLERLALTDSRMQVFRGETNLGFVGTCNRGLAERSGDAVLLNNDTVVTRGWLQELAEVSHSDPRTACASPLSNHASICSVPVFGVETPAVLIDMEAVEKARAGLPRWTETPTAHGFCIFLRGTVLDLVGHLDPVFSPGYNEENDWVMRAQAMGFVAKRANHAFVYHLGSRSFGPEKIALEERNARLLAERHPHYSSQVARFHYSLESRIASQAVRVESSGAIRVALDLRHLPPDPVGTGTYAIGLARALAAVPEIELTLIVRHENQATGIAGRCVSEQYILEDVDVIHRPAQVFEPADLRVLFQSPAHTVITHLDLIAHRAEGLFPSQFEADRYRATSALILPAAQSVIAISEDARREMVAEFGLPAHEIAVTPLGVDHARFANGGEDDNDQFPEQVSPGRFLLSVATDFPHKNVKNLIEAHARLRARWSLPGEPPRLVLVGSPASIRDGLYRQFSGESPPPDGVQYVGPVTEGQLRALYRSAEALVFPSVYEGFGLPILEAMAAGTPVIALPISSAPEVGGDAVLYAEGTSPLDLAIAMERLAGDRELRDDLRARGPGRAERFRWEQTASLTIAAYRSAIFRPSERSLRARRQLTEVILAWAYGTCCQPLAAERFCCGVSVSVETPCCEPVPTETVVCEVPVAEETPGSEVPAPAEPVSSEVPVPEETARFDVWAPEPNGIRGAWKDLNRAVNVRVRRDLGRMLPSSRRRST